MKQSNTTFNELVKTLDEFDRARGWMNLDPGDLAKSIALEASELLEFYQWDNSLKNRGAKIPSKDKQEIGFEVADILIYLLKFCRETKIDIVDATLKKLEHNNKKYPVGYKAKGDHLEYQRIKKEYRSKKSAK